MQDGQHRKDAKVPAIVGPPSCAKSTLLDPVRNVFGKDAVLGKPKLGAANGALSQKAQKAESGVRSTYFDDDRPVDYAA